MMSVPASQTCISAVNGAAIAAMQQGKYAHSTMALKRALAVLKASLNADNANEFATSAVKPEDQGLLWSVACANPDTTAAIVGSSNNFEVFQSAFHLPDDRWCSANKTRASVIILYNMGLSYHLSGLSRGSSKELSMARDLYKMALTIVETSLAQVHTDRLLLLQLLALFNNLGHIHSYCYEESDTKQCMTAIKALLASRAYYHAKCEDATEAFAFFEWSTLSITSPENIFTFAPAA
ncbi:expressed unknown protein [Seminavis robusta]|uniref:Uncharacterized protein n=1 Tax=Seminavis robusta TaxID=568900 RepID=A0A9N8DU29_9STRA|nr:expressed unknown protein [Seminavis robusta]|eukprot:Sro343_g122090.1 n/a (237) ;mRNA; r:67738-68448